MTESSELVIVRVEESSLYLLTASEAKVVSLKGPLGFKEGPFLTALILTTKSLLTGIAGKVILILWPVSAVQVKGLLLPSVQVAPDCGTTFVGNTMTIEPPLSIEDGWLKVKV